MRSRFHLSWGIIFLSLGILSLGILSLGWLHSSQKVYGLVTLDAQSGKVLWSTPVDDLAPIRRIITHNGQVYTLSSSYEDGLPCWLLCPRVTVGITKVTAFDAVSGKQLWQFKTDSNVSDWADIQVTEKSVLLKTDKITAIDPTNGQSQWSVSLPVNSQRPDEVAPPFNPNMVVSRDRVALLRVLETPDKRTSRVSVETWQKTTGEQHQAFTPTLSSADLYGSSLAATNDTILLFLPSQPIKVSGYAPETGKLKFSMTTVVNQGGSVRDFYRYLSFNGSTIYQYIYNGPNRGKSAISVEAYDANTGKLRWQVPITDSRCVDFRAVTGGFYLSCNGFSSSPAYLKFLDEKTGQQRWIKRFTEGTRLELASTYNAYPLLYGYGMTSDAIVANVHRRVDAERESVRLVVFSKTDGRELWSGDSYETSLYGADGDRVFLNCKFPNYFALIFSRYFAL